jgi:hypothetical protein
LVSEPITRLSTNFITLSTKSPMHWRRKNFALLCFRTSKGFDRVSGMEGYFSN